MFSNPRPINKGGIKYHKWIRVNSYNPKVFVHSQQHDIKEKWNWRGNTIKTKVLGHLNIIPTYQLLLISQEATLSDLLLCGWVTVVASTLPFIIPLITDCGISRRAYILHKLNCWCSNSVRSLEQPYSLTLYYYSTMFVKTAWCLKCLIPYTHGNIMKNT